MSNDANNAFGSLVRTNMKQLPKRPKLACQNEIYQVMVKYMTASENIEKPLINQFSQKTYAQFSEQPVYTNFTASSQNIYYKS